MSNRYGLLCLFFTNNSECVEWVLKVFFRTALSPDCLAIEASIGFGDSLENRFIKSQGNTSTSSGLRFPTSPGSSSASSKSSTYYGMVLSLVFMVPRPQVMFIQRGTLRGAQPTATHSWAPTARVGNRGRIPSGPPSGGKVHQTTRSLIGWAGRSPRLSHPLFRLSPQ